MRKDKEGKRTKSRSDNLTEFPRAFESILGGMVSWKIVSVLTKFRESSPGKFDLFLWYFFLLENSYVF